MSLKWILISLGIFLVIYAGFAFVLFLLGRRQDARAWAGLVPDCIMLFRRLLSDPAVPRRSKFLLILLLGYLALPIDLVPDLIPVAGQLDDAIIVVLVLRHLLKSADEVLLRKYWPGPVSSLNTLLRMAVVQKRAG